MTYRAALQLVAQGTAPADALARYDLEDVSPDALSSALRHYAETSPIEVADLLSPFLARTSPVPFEEGDLESLPEADAILADGGGIADLLTEIGLDPGSIDIEATLDAAEAAAADAAGELDEVIEAAGEAADDADRLDDTFGVGDEQPSPESEAADVLEQIGRSDGDGSGLGSDEFDGPEGDVGVDTESFTEFLDEFDRLGEAADIDELDESGDPLDFDLDG